MLGGTAQVDDWSLDIRDEDNDLILSKVEAIWPDLDRERIVGARSDSGPREQGQAERKKRLAGFVIHNYGHGGAEVTLSWGCADEVVSIAEGIRIPMEETFDVVDRSDTVIGQASREEAPKGLFTGRPTSWCSMAPGGSCFRGRWKGQVSREVGLFGVRARR